MRVVPWRERRGGVLRAPRATDAGNNFDFATNAKLPRRPSATTGRTPRRSTTTPIARCRSCSRARSRANETYSLVAFILALNEIVPEDAVMDAAALPKVKMPARDRFVIDNRKGGKVVK